MQSVCCCRSIGNTAIDAGAHSWKPIIFFCSSDSRREEKGSWLKGRAGNPQFHPGCRDVKMKYCGGRMASGTLKPFSGFKTGRPGPARAPRAHLQPCLHRAPTQEDVRPSHQRDVDRTSRHGCSPNQPSVSINRVDSCSVWDLSFIQARAKVHSVPLFLIIRQRGLDH